MKSLLAAISLLLLSTVTLAAEFEPEIPPIAPQPTPCIIGSFTSTGDTTWKNIVLTLTNTCNKPVDFQNTSVSFSSLTELNTRFWGTFDPLPYPDNDLKITSTQQADKTFLATLMLHFPVIPGTSTILPNGQSITIKYSAPTESHTGTVNVYLGTPALTGSLTLTHTTAKPANVTRDTVLIHLTAKDQKATDVELHWKETKTIPDLPPGDYTVSPESLTDSAGSTYNGTATPATVKIIENQTATSSIAYTLISDTGKIAIQLQALPPDLAGYTENPTATLTQVGASGSVSQALQWNSTTTVSKLLNKTAYKFSTGNISYNNFLCSPAFTPETLIANDTTTPSANLLYHCIKTIQDNVTINVSGAPTTLNTLYVTLTPHNRTAGTRQAIALNNGSGSSVIKLTDGAVYTVSSFAVANYDINYNPKQLTVTENAVEDITLTKTVATPVSIHGQLHVCGVKLCNQYGQPIQLRGMSTHGLQWYGWNVCLTPESLDTLAKEWRASVIRLSMYVQDGGYETDPDGFTAQVNQLIAEASQRGIYVIVDWHILTPGDPNDNLVNAKKFFTAIATANKGKTNLIYEIANAPNGASWDSIKRYAAQIIPVIRAIDPKAVMLVGTRGYSSLGLAEGSNSQEIIKSPLNFPNILYAFHFYANAQREDYLHELDAASDKLPIFVSEFGSQNTDGDGENDLVMTGQFVQLMAKKKIGWVNWSFSDSASSSAVWSVGTCAAGTWGDDHLQPAGVYIKNEMQS